MQQRHTEALGSVTAKLRRVHDGPHIGSANALRRGRFGELLHRRDRSAGATRHRDRERCLERSVLRHRLARPFVKVDVLIGVTKLIVVLIGRARRDLTDVTCAGDRAALDLVVLRQCGFQLRPSAECVHTTGRAHRGETPL